MSYALARDETDTGNSKVHVENSEVAMRLLKEQRSRKLPRSVTRMDTMPSGDGHPDLDMIIASVVIQAYFRRVIKTREDKKAAAAAAGATKQDMPPAEGPPAIVPPPVESPANAADVKPAVEESPKAVSEGEPSSGNVTGIPPLKGPVDIIAQKAADNVPGQVNPRSSSEDAASAE